MQWPQLTMAVLLMWWFVAGFLSIAKDREHSSGWATFGIFVQALICIGVALVLRAGGFW